MSAARSSGEDRLHPVAVLDHREALRPFLAVLGLRSNVDFVSPSKNAEFLVDFEVAEEAEIAEALEYSSSIQIV